MRDRANSSKQSADREKNTAESQLDDLTSQKPDDADAAGAAMQETLSEIAEKDIQIRARQRQVFCFSYKCMSVSIIPPAFCFR